MAAGVYLLGYIARGVALRVWLLGVWLPGDVAARCEAGIGVAFHLLPRALVPITTG